MDLRAKALGVCAAVLAPITALAQTPSFTLLGAAPNNLGSVARAVSADGGVVAGYSVNLNGSPGFTWTPSGGRSDFGLLPGMPATTQAYGISGDGLTAVGSMTGAHAFRRAGNSPIQDLGVLSGYTRSSAVGTDGTGSVVVGVCETSASYTFGQAFRWTSSGGMQGLGFTQGPNGIYSEATGISRDGATIVGNSNDAAGLNDAFIWRQGIGFTVLPQVLGTPAGESGAYGTNYNGSIVVGYSGILQTPAIWRNGQVTDLGAAPGYVHGTAVAVSDDGSVVAGRLLSATNQVAAVWTPARGMEPLSDYLVANGVVIPDGWTLTNCYAVSGDGFTFVGLANPSTGFGQGFVATIPEPATVLALGLLAALLRQSRFPAEHRFRAGLAR